MSASKKDELIQKALKVFYQHGFHATGMDMLVKETGISKTSMYKHFKTKEDLILATLELRDKNFRNFFMGRTQELAKTPAEQLLATFQTLGEWFESAEFKSCMFIKASSEYQNTEHPIHTASAAHKSMILHYLESLATQANYKNPKDLARQLLLLKEGAIVMAHMHGAGTYAQDARKAAEALISASQSPS